MKVYADNAATTTMSNKVIEAMSACFQECYGNPSSTHSWGTSSKRAIEKSRSIFSDYLLSYPDEIIFTSGGSESDTQAIISAAVLGANEGKRHIVSSRFEHKAVLKTLEYLVKHHFEVTLIDIPTNGVIMPEQVEKAIRSDTCLVSIMFVNNEVGTIQPIEELGRICKKHGVLFHTDAVQAAGHIKIELNKLNVDYMSFSAHKFHGPKGVGILYAKRNVPVQKIIFGGEQENGCRGGTENFPSIVGSAIAFEESCSNLEKNNRHLSKLSEQLITGVKDIPGVSFNGDYKLKIPGINSLGFERIDGENLVIMLDGNGIAASSGSACTSSSLLPSHVLLSMGQSPEQANSAVRFSFSEYNTVEEVDYILANLPSLVYFLRGSD